MAIAVGGLFIALIGLTILTVAAIEWALVPAETKARLIPAVGGLLGDIAKNIRETTYAAARAIIGGLIQLTIWAVQGIHSFLNDAVSVITGPLATQVAIAQHDIDSIINAFNTYVNADLASLRKDVDSILNAFTTYVNADLASLRHDVDAILKAFNTYVNATLAKLTTDVAAITRTVDNTLTPILTAATTAITHIEKVLIPGVQADIRELGNLFTLLVTKPVTGLLDRVTSIEKQLTQVFPWAAAIGLSIPVAANLGKLGRNPCWCQQEGPLQDDGTLALASLMDLI